MGCSDAASLLFLTMGIAAFFGMRYESLAGFGIGVGINLLLLGFVFEAAVSAAIGPDLSHFLVIWNGLIKVCPGPAWGSIAAGWVVGGVIGFVAERHATKRAEAERFDRAVAAGEVLAGDHTHSRPVTDTEVGAHLKEAHRARNIQTGTQLRPQLMALHEYLHKPA